MKSQWEVSEIAKLSSAQRIWRKSWVERIKRLKHDLVWAKVQVAEVWKRAKSSELTWVRIWIRLETVVIRVISSQMSSKSKWCSQAWQKGIPVFDQGIKIVNARWASHQKVITHSTWKPSVTRSKTRSKALISLADELTHETCFHRRIIRYHQRRLKISRVSTCHKLGPGERDVVDLYQDKYHRRAIDLVRSDRSKVCWVLNEVRKTQSTHLYRAMLSLVWQQLVDDLLGKMKILLMQSMVHLLMIIHSTTHYSEHPCKVHLEVRAHSTQCLARSTRLLPLLLKGCAIKSTSDSCSYTLKVFTETLSMILIEWTRWILVLKLMRLTTW